MQVTGKKSVVNGKWGTICVQMLSVAVSHEHRDITGFEDYQVGVPAALHTAVYRTVKMCVLAVRVSVGQSSVGQLLTGCLFCTC